MKKRFSAARKMLKGMNEGTAARKMLSESNKFARKMEKRIK